MAINLTDMERYEYENWVELEKINKAIAANESIEKNILNSYMQLQINASRMSFRAKALRVEAVHNKCRQDYVKYGMSIELWTGCLA